MTDLKNATFMEEGGEGPKGLPAPHPLHILIGIQVAICLMGSSANLLVINWYSQLEERTYGIAVLSLACKDLLSASIFLPMSIIMESLEFKVYNDTFCKLFHYLGNVGGQFSFSILLLISLERCACVCHSRNNVTRIKLAFGAAMAAVFCALLISVPVSLGFGVYRKKSQISTQSKNNSAGNFQDEVENVGYCHANDLLISMSSMEAYTEFIKIEIALEGAFMCILYLCTLSFIFYRKYNPKSLLLESQLREISDRVETQQQQQHQQQQQQQQHQQPYRDPGCIGDEINAFLMESEQKWWTFIFVVISLTYWLLSLPAILMSYKHLPAEPIAFHAYQIHFVCGPIVYFLMDSAFRKNVMNMFRTNLYGICC